MNNEPINYHNHPNVRELGKLLGTVKILRELVRYAKLLRKLTECS